MRKSIFVIALVFWIYFVFIESKPNVVVLLFMSRGVQRNSKGEGETDGGEY